MKLKGLTFGLLALIFVLGSIGLTGCGSKETAQAPTNEPAKTEPAPAPAAEEKVYKIGTDAAYPPFEKQEGGQIVGFDADVLNAIAEAAGIKVELFHAGWDPLFEGIDRGTIDAGISAITITEDRKKVYDFSEPYFEASQLIMVPKDSTVTVLADLEGKKIGVQSATTGDLAVQEAFGKTYAGIKGYEDTPSAVDDLVIGRVDAVVADNAVLQEYLKVLNNDQFKVVKDPAFAVEYYGMMVKKGNTELLAKLNEGLKIIKENGKYDEIFNKYFAE